MSRYVLICAGVIIFLAFWSTVFYNTLNAPSFDDYDATISFIRNFYFDGYTLPEKIASLLRAHNEHRIFLSRFSAAAYYYFFQVINFEHLVLFQNLFLLATFALCLRIMVENKVPFSFAFVLLCVSLCNLSFYQVSFFYWGGIQYYTVFFFSILSLFVLDKSGKVWSTKFAVAILSAVMAVICFGNGFIVLFLGGFLLWAQKKFAQMYVWAVFSISLLFILFANVPKVEHAQKVAFNIEWMARLLFTFVGSFTFVNPEGMPGRYGNIIVCSLVGLPIFVFWVVLFFRGFAAKNPLLYTLFCLPILTAIVIAVARFDTKAAGGTAPRYMFFTALIPVFLTLILWRLEILRRKHLNSISVVLCTLWLANFYFNGKELRRMNADLADRIVRWQDDHSVQLVYFAEPAGTSRTMEWATKNKVVPSVEKMTEGQINITRNR